MASVPEDSYFLSLIAERIYSLSFEVDFLLLLYGLSLPKGLLNIA
jgi:hypothetical protein